METQTRKLLARCGAPPGMQLGTFIDMHASADYEELQALRRNLYARMQHVRQGNEESRMHLKASHDVAIGILQHIGIVESHPTYGPGGRR